MGVKYSSRPLKNYGVDFEDFSEKIMKDGAMSAKVKRLIAIVSAVAVGCDYCVDHHVKLMRRA